MPVRALQKSVKMELGTPTFPRIISSNTSLNKLNYSKHDIVLQLTGVRGSRLPHAPDFAVARLRHKLNRNAPALVTLPSGTRAVQLRITRQDRFDTQTMIRKGLDLAKAKPGAKVAVDVRNLPRQRIILQDAIYTAGTYLARMPDYSNERKDKKDSVISVHGAVGHSVKESAKARAEANVLCRWLCIQPSNVLDPATLVEFCKTYATKHHLEFEHIDVAALKKKGAGAFLAVAGKKSKGGIVRISYRSKKKARRTVSFVGKGICFDTGGLNVKAPKHMIGMHADMAGAAAAFAATIAAAQLKLQIDVDAWLVIAENLVGPEAMKPGDVVKTLSKKTIEIVDTDAEGRLLLAEGLGVATKTKPDAIATLATLTGAMAVAVGTRMSGLTGNKGLVEKALEASKDSGERMHEFPLPKDYADKLDSKIADIAQCATSSEADHILAGLFIKEFTKNLPWLHVDLSAATSENGLGSVPTDQTGFGANWAVCWLERMARR